MRRIILCIIGVVSAACCFAADTSWDFLKGVKAIDVEIDYHQAIINNSNETEFVQYYSQYIQQENWYPIAQKRWKMEFLEEFADETMEKHCLAGDIPSAKIKLLITILSLTDSGNLVATVAFIDKENDTTLKTIEVKSKGGHWGGIVSLIADGFEHLGEDMGRQVRKHL